MLPCCELMPLEMNICNWHVQMVGTSFRACLSPMKLQTEEGSMFDLQHYEVSPSPQRSAQCCPICYPPRGSTAGVRTEHLSHCVSQTAKECVNIVHPLHSLTDTSELLKRIEDIEQRLTVTRSTAAQPSAIPRQPASTIIEREIYVDRNVRVESNHSEVVHFEQSAPPHHQPSPRRSPSPMEIQRISTSRGTCASPAFYEQEDESTATEVLQSVDRGCGDSLAASQSSSPKGYTAPPALLNPTVQPRSTELLILQSVLQERFAGYQESLAANFDNHVLRKSDLHSTATAEVFARTHAALVAARSLALRTQEASRMSLFLFTVSRLEEIASDHTLAIGRYFEESLTKSTVAWSQAQARSAAERTAVHVIPKSSSNSSIMELNHRAAFDDDAVDSDNGEPIEPRLAVPRQPTPVGTRKSSLTQNTLRVTTVVARQPHSTNVAPTRRRFAPQLAAPRTGARKALLQPPWNGSTSTLENAIPQARSNSAPRKKSSSYAEAFAMATAARSRLGVEEPTSSFLESATPRYQVRFANVHHHHRHARCHDHWCEDLDLH